MQEIIILTALLASVLLNFYLYHRFVIKNNKPFNFKEYAKEVDEIYQKKLYQSLLENPYVTYNNLDQQGKPIIKVDFTNHKTEESYKIPNLIKVSKEDIENKRNEMFYEDMKILSEHFNVPYDYDPKIVPERDTFDIGTHEIKVSDNYLSIGKAYYFDTKNDSCGIYKGATDKGHMFEPIRNFGNYHVMNDGFIYFAIINGFFSEV